MKRSSERRHRWACTWVLSGLVVLSGTAHGHAIDHLQDTSDVGLHKVPHEGTSRILVIPTRVGREFPAAELEHLRAYFAEEGGPGTFREYWRVQSLGRFDPIPTLVEPVIYSECPIPGKGPTNCQIYWDDLVLLAQGAARDAFIDLLGRVRDEQGIDLSQFDVNGPGGEPDGYFDGVIIDTDMFSGVGFPLAALGNAVTVETTPRPLSGEDAGTTDGGALDGGLADAGDLDAGPADGGAPDGGSGDAGPSGPVLTLGIVALIPPETHEFGHLLGFIDLYGGPTVTGLMARKGSGLSAHSRLRIGWGEVLDVAEPGEIDLLPVLEGGPILRFGVPPRYVLVEYRGGALHGPVEDDYPGLYGYSVDETKLPQGELGFLDLNIGDLYLPNREEPYLNVNIPIGCRPVAPQEGNACVLGSEGVKLDLKHASGEHMGFYIERGPRQPDGSLRVFVREGRLAPPPDAGPDDAGDASGDAGRISIPPDEERGCGCAQGSGSAPAAALFALGFLALLVRSTRRRR